MNKELYAKNVLDIILLITTDTTKALRIERWNDKWRHWRVGINWFGEGDYEFIVERPTLLDALQVAYRFVLGELEGYE